MFKGIYTYILESHLENKMLNPTTIIGAMKLIMLAAVLFVWFVRYDNIVMEFKQYEYPNWMRDLVGILKVSLVFMIQSQNTDLVKLGCLGLGVLMAAALSTHFKVKNPIYKALPSFTLMCFSAVVYLNS